MTAPLIEAIVFLAGIGLLTWQFQWLLRSYRTERDRQAQAHRSSRMFLLALALTVFVALASIINLPRARRIAVGAILVVSAVEAVQRRWVKWKVKPDGRKGVMGEVVKMPDALNRTAQKQRTAERVEAFLSLHEAHNVTQSATVVECHTCNEHLKIQDGKGGQ